MYGCPSCVFASKETSLEGLYSFNAAKRNETKRSVDLLSCLPILPFSLHSPALSYTYCKTVWNFVENPDCLTAPCDLWEDMFLGARVLPKPALPNGYQHRWWSERWNPGVREFVRKFSHVSHHTMYRTTYGRNPTYLIHERIFVPHITHSTHKHTPVFLHRARNAPTCQWYICRESVWKNVNWKFVCVCMYVFM